MHLFSATTRRAASSSGWFWAWALVGFGGALSAVSLGPLLFVPVFLAALFLARRPSARRSAWGAITGAGGLLLFVAWVQRSGEALDPLPWLVAGVALFVAGIVAQLRN